MEGKAESFIPVTMTEKVLWKELKAEDKARNRKRRAELAELVEDYNSGLFPGEKRALREDEEFFIIVQNDEESDNTDG